MSPLTDHTGGRATVIAVERVEDQQTWFVTVEGIDGRFNWKNLAQEQEKLKEEYGSERAKPDPDLKSKPEF